MPSIMNRPNQARVRLGNFAHDVEGRQYLGRRKLLQESVGHGLHPPGVLGFAGGRDVEAHRRFDPVVFLHVE